MGDIALMLLRPPDKIEAFAFHLRRDKSSESDAPFFQGICDQACLSSAVPAALI
jgi:hypothetical protein